MNLQQQLVSQGKTRWLDIGCGGRFDDGFHYVDIFPISKIPGEYRNRYYRVDMVTAKSADLKKLGKFNFVRLQHTFEHFSLEEGKEVLKNCAKLLEPGGIILITTPDLRIHIDKYLTGSYRKWKGFTWWANKRIPVAAPDSFYFSIFAHSMPWESHKWCYDSEGLIFQLKSVALFKNIKEMKVDDNLASVPFTHNRPEEDVCVIANLK